MEPARRFLRNSIGYRSWPYRWGSAAADAVAVMGKEGVGTFLELKRLQARVEDAIPSVSLDLKGLDHPIRLRPGTQDAKTVIDSVVRAEYGRYRPTVEPRWIVDAGAFIGDTAAYFLSRFPAARVIALEPNRASLEVAEKNLSPYGDRAVLLGKGLWSSAERLGMKDDGTGSSLDDGGGEIECVDLPTLLEDYEIPRLDILKMDVEGAEAQIFSTNPERWLSRVGMLLIELHGERNRSLVLGVMKENGFGVRQFRSVWYFNRDFPG